MSSVFALVDCNAFFCSCEQSIRPELQGKPVAVLSNNDGCIVSLNREAKKAGLKMGDVYFKIRDLCLKHQVHVFSSHFSLYGNMSDRVMKVLSQYTPDIEYYSIDEAFLEFRGFDYFDLKKQAKKMKEEVMRLTSIPVCVGLAPNKVLAKLANHRAKKNLNYGGVVDLRDQREREDALKETSVEDIWGVGHQSSLKLKRLGIFTAWDFVHYKNDGLIQKVLHKPGRQIQDELRGFKCLNLNPQVTARQMILVSRSFEKNSMSKDFVFKQVMKHFENAMRKLISDGSAARGVSVFMRTNPFSPTAQYRDCKSRTLMGYSDKREDLLALVMELFEEVFKSGYEYKKCGVYLFDLVPKNEAQLDLFSRPSPVSNFQRLILEHQFSFSRLETIHPDGE